ncbi:MAG: 50S ribosomal protein L6 [Marinilabiliales bacterium]|nr:MAG: 50S ribosomal protein L6 [Marinilabiliales bacterium]
MSRIGKLPVQIPEKVTVSVNADNLVTVKGPLGELTQQVDPAITVEVEEAQVVVGRKTDEKEHRAKHGLYRSLISNMVIGVSEGFETQQELIGVGYKAEANGQMLYLALGFSHTILFELPPEVKVEVKSEKRGNSTVIFRSIDKQLIGQVAAKLRSLRPPEPYKGKGIKFVGEELRRKAGKSAKV